MTEPDPVAALAAQLEELRGQLARTQGEVGYLKARLERDSGQVLMYRLEIKQLRERLEEAIDKRRLAPPSAPWWVVDEATGREMLTALREWVDQFLRKHYPGYLAGLPRCWANHGEAVWELSTICAEWERIYADEGNRDLAGALTWHDRYLPDVISRLAAAIKCDETGCRTARLR